MRIRSSKKGKHKMRRTHTELNRNEILDIIGSYEKRITRELDTVLNEIHIPERIPTHDELYENTNIPVIYSSIDDGYINTVIVYKLIMITICEKEFNIVITDLLDETFHVDINDYEWVYNIFIYVEGFIQMYIRQSVRKELSTL